MGDFDARGESVAGGGGGGPKKSINYHQAEGISGEKDACFFPSIFWWEYIEVCAVVNQCEFLFGTGLRKMSDFARFLRHRGSKRSWDIKGGMMNKRKKLVRGLCGKTMVSFSSEY